MPVAINRIAFEKVVEVINAQAAALEALTARVGELEQKISFLFQTHNAPPV